MGEKETGTATEEGERRQHGPGPVRPASDPGDVDGDGALDEGPVSVVKTKTKSNQSNDRLGREDDPAAVEGEGGGAVNEDPVSDLKSKYYNQKTNDRGDRQGAGDLSPDTDEPTDLDDDGDGTLDEGPVSVLKNKTKSNQSNDRLGHEDDPDGAGGLDDDGDGVAGVINTTRSNIKSTS